MLTVSILVIVAAFICTIAAAAAPARVPLWVAVLLLCVFGLLQVLPK